MPHISLKTISRSSSRGLTSLSDVDNHLRTTLDSLISEINLAFQDVGDLAEVEKVFTDIDDLPLDNNDIPQYDLTGAIRFKKLTSSVDTNNIGIAKPFNPNLKEFPVEGEYVTIRYIFGQYFYGERVNIFGNPNNASYPDVASKYTRVGGRGVQSSKVLETSESGMVENVSTTEEEYLGNYFKPNFVYKQLLPNEGDTILEGRFGNSIRLSSNEKQDVENSPNIKLRAGQLQDANKFGQEELVNTLEETSFKEVPVVEDINSDGSSMWMTTNETVRLTPATLEDTNIYPTDTAPEVFDGKQIILNSGRLIFNSKEKGILGFSDGPIDFSTLNSFGVAAKQDLNLYSPSIKVCRDGENGKTKSISLLGQDIYLQNESGYTFVTSKGIELGSSNLEPAVKGDTLEEILSELMDVVSDLSSAVATIVTTPVTIGVLATPTPQPYAREASRAYQALSSLATLSIKLNTMKSRVVTLQ